VSYWLRALAGFAVFVSAVVLFDVKLMALLDTVGCAGASADGDCADEAGTDALLMIVAVLGVLAGAYLFAARGRRPGQDAPSSIAFPLIAWGGAFAASGAAVLIHALTSEAIPPDGKLGALILGTVFLLYGLPTMIVGWPSGDRDG
jgi:hypothetical protein